MVYDNNMFYPKYNIPQTVPTGVYSADDFATYTDNLDFSILQSNDGEVPLSPQSQQNLQNTNNLLAPEYIPVTVFQDLLHQQQQQQTLLYPSPNAQTTEHHSMRDDDKHWMKLSDDLNNNCTQDFLNQLTTDYQYQYPSPLPSPPQDHNSHQYTNIFPPSPCSSVEYNSYSIKQEFTILPPSPPDSNGAPSPLSEVKSEPDHDSEVCIDIESLLNDSFEVSSTPKKLASHQQHQEQQQPQQSQDHQLLREYLQDTTFQKKHNLKPLALESLLGGWGARGDIEPVFSLALEQIRRDVQDTCAALDIPPDPQLWSADQVQSWLKSQISTWRLHEISNISLVFPEAGREFSMLSEEDFVRRVPESGATLYAQLVVWKGACTELFSSPQTPNPLIPSTSSSTVDWSMPIGQNTELSDDEDEEMPAQPQITPSAPEVTPATTTPTPTRTGRQGGSHIHLWQFLKELLATPQTHGAAIRWLDRTKGVFKIEDSVRVARLWGRRKNRPAMNYDKLSRSIRQYYKKGIMKKTERSQRLVYQFCHPYCL